MQAQIQAVLIVLHAGPTHHRLPDGADPPSGTTSAQRTCTCSLDNAAGNGCQALQYGDPARSYNIGISGRGQVGTNRFACNIIDRQLNPHLLI
jgi:hypothetical protein